MFKNFRFILLILFSFLLIQCANRGNPTGGPVDLDPPRFIRASPENYTTNFNRDEIRIYFDEYIKLNKPQEQIIISPPLQPRPEISPLGSPQRFVRIRINDTLQENTTYVFNFGNSIVDNNEGNPLPFFKYVFSTGTYIDSLTVSGTVDDALLLNPEPFISVMLYERDESFRDSLVYLQPPRYITNTLDSLRTFELTNLKEGTYQLVALKDRNNDYKYNPGREKIAFVSEPITIPTTQTFNLVLFRENLIFQPERPKLLAQNKILLGYRGRVNPDSIAIEPISNVSPDFDYRFTKVPEKDSLHIWFKPRFEGDSLKFKLRSPNRVDTLMTRITDMQRDTLQITTEPAGNIDFNKSFIIRANTPIVDMNEEMITIMNRDSVFINFTSEIRPYENTIHLQFPKNENQAYMVRILPGAVTDFYNSTNDTIRKTVNTKSFSDYGNATINLQNVRSYPIIVQLTTDKGVVRAQQYLTQETSVRFEFITPGAYLMRIIYDENENGVWDTGNYLENTQPEEIIYYPETLNVRPNWDSTDTFIIN